MPAPPTKPKINFNPTAREFKPPGVVGARVIVSAPSSAPLPPEAPVKKPLSYNPTTTKEFTSTLTAASSHSKVFKPDPTAGAYVPKESAPPPILLPPAVVPVVEAATLHPMLHTPWTLWCTIQTSDEFTCNKLHTVSSVKDFWSMMNSVRISIAHEEADLSRMALHLFREGIEPKWEDPANIHGGCWQMSVAANTAFRESIDDRFRQLCSWAVGEPRCHGNSVTGVGFKVRDKYTVQVWTREVPTRTEASRRNSVALVEDCAVYLNFKGVRADYFIHAQRENTKNGYAPPVLQHQMF